MWRVNRLLWIPLSLIILFYLVSLIKLISTLGPETVEADTRSEDEDLVPILGDEDVMSLKDVALELPVVNHTEVEGGVKLEEEEEDISLDIEGDEEDTDEGPTTQPPTTEAPGVDAKYLHILSYQRSGSSFMGKLFDSHPDAFFVYEPMSMLFTALYGILEDRAIPNNIFFDHYGNFRNLSTVQSELMTKTLTSIYKCRLSTFPMAMLITNWWYRYQNTYMTGGKGYVRCLETIPHLNFSTGDEGLGVCLEHLREPCPRSYNTLLRRQLKNCQNILWHNGTWTRSDSDDLWKDYAHSDFLQYRQNFVRYFSCLNSMEPRVRQCARDHLDETCSKASLRVAKTVRSPMEVSRKLFDLHPRRFNLIHLLRDPRGVTLSRLRAEWAHGYFERQDPDPRVLSDSYCRNALRDVQERQELEEEHSDNIMEIVYDHFMKDIIRNSRSVLDMLDMGDTFSKVSHIFEVKADAERKDRWKTWLKEEDISAIEKACPSFFSRYKLPLTTTVE